MGKMKLKPCPFCGGDAVLLPYATSWWMARCMICGANVKEVTKYKKQIAAAWNKRIKNEK